MSRYTYGVNLKELPHRGDCLRPPVEGNQLYPLPPRFHDLSQEEQSWWNVNACCLQETPEDFVQAYVFFVNRYLWPSEACFFHTKRRIPPFHLQMVHDIAAYMLNVFIAPRYSCKTTVALINCLLLLLTRRDYRVGYLTSRQKKYRKGLNTVKRQLERNGLILQDFRVPAHVRGKEERNKESIELPPPFNTELTGMSVGSAERGWHGETLFGDDCEKDPDSDEVIPDLVEKFAYLLHHEFLPMIEIAPEDLDREDVGHMGRSITIFGTKIGEDMMLNRIATAEPGGLYDAWNKQIFEQFVEVPTDDVGGEKEVRYLWPQRWGEKASSYQRIVLGDAAFSKEKLGRVGRLTKGKWVIHPLFHTYDLRSTDDLIDSQPFASQSIVRWAVPNGRDGYVYRTAKMYEWLARMDIGIVCDPANTLRRDEVPSTESDPTVFHVFGNDQDGCLWSLDLMRGRYNTDEAVHAAEVLFNRWRPSFIAIEACGFYMRIAQEVYNRLRDRLVSEWGWAPYPRELGPYNKKIDSKDSRIDSASWRFATYKIRFPQWRRNSNPYSHLWYEVENFVPGARRLKNDDIVDTIGLCRDVFRGPGSGKRGEKEDEYTGKSAEQLILNGIFYTSDGHPLVPMLVGMGQISEEALCRYKKAKPKELVWRPRHGKRGKARIVRV